MRSDRRLARLVRAALAEDRGRGDITTDAIVSPRRRARAAIVAGQNGVVAGLAPAAAVFAALGATLKPARNVRDGTKVAPGRRVAEIHGPLRAILTGERAALNFLCRLSGIATLTRKFVDAARPARAAILDTRKTTPLLRALEKQAVLAGGGRSHRKDLASAVLIKDNHIAAAGSIERAVALVRARSRLRIEVEAQSLPQVRAALAARVDVIMLDNLSAPRMRAAIRRIRGHRRVKIELSGGVNLRNVARLARLEPDYISVGALTHSAPALDFSLDVLPS